MIGFKTTARSFGKQIDAEIEKMDLMLNGVMRGLAITAFGVLLEETPQWSGNAAANWNFSIGSPDLSTNHKFKRDLDKSNAPISLAASMEAKSKGDPEAIIFAIRQNAGREVGITYRTPVFLSNSAENLSGESYIHMLELNPNNFLRAENAPGHMTFTAKAVLSDFVNISTKTAKMLGSKRISDLSGGGTQLRLF